MNAIRPMPTLAIRVTSKATVYKSRSTVKGRRRLQSLSTEPVCIFIARQDQPYGLDVAVFGARPK